MTQKTRPQSVYSIYLREDENRCIIEKVERGNGVVSITICCSSCLILVNIESLLQLLSFNYICLSRQANGKRRALV